ncbi:YceI family protein [Streptomyces sp. 7N604]|uniref:YceI family protein n=1 Tax=Streptomyces sp. 7N604 TaxID=3457415 RepID=UPI003FD06AFE
MSTVTLPTTPAPPPAPGPDWLPSPGTYAVAPGLSVAELTARLGPLPTLRGRMTLAGASLTVAADPDPALSTLRIDLDSGSLRTGRLLGDGRLRGRRGLDAERHPLLTFVSRRIEPAAGGKRLDVPGDLVVRGVPIATTLRLRVVEPTEDRLLVVGHAEAPYRPLSRATGFALPRPTAPASRLRLLVAAEFA